MVIRSIVVLIMLSMDLSDSSKMRMGQVIKFDLFTFDNSTISSYFTKISVGTPLRVFNVLIDTGSDLTWIGCSNTDRNFFNMSDSSTATINFCSNGKPCPFDNGYKDGTISSGYMVSDVFHFNAFLPDSSTVQFSSHITFGCSTMNKLKNMKMDGILGLGRGSESLVSQLFSKSVAPKVVSHCLANKGDGYLLLGEVVENGFTYTPLIPSKSQYQVSLESVSVNGRRINAATSAGIHDTIVDSGTTKTLLVAAIYDRLIQAVSAAVNKSALPLFGQSCYDVPSSDSFPQITINFGNGASILSMPKDYVQFAASHLWCLRFVRDEDITILGDLVLRDKVTVYDQPRERIGWLSRDYELQIRECLLHVQLRKRRNLEEISLERYFSSCYLVYYFLLNKPFSCVYICNSRPMLTSLNQSLSLNILGQLLQNLCCLQITFFHLLPSTGCWDD